MDFSLDTAYTYFQSRLGEPLQEASWGLGKSKNLQGTETNYLLRARSLTTVEAKSAGLEDYKRCTEDW